MFDGLARRGLASVDPMTARRPLISRSRIASAGDLARNRWILCTDETTLSAIGRVLTKNMAGMPSRRNTGSACSYCSRSPSSNVTTSDRSGSGRCHAHRVENVAPADELAGLPIIASVVDSNCSGVMPWMPG